MSWPLRRAHRPTDFAQTTDKADQSCTNPSCSAQSAHVTSYHNTTQNNTSLHARVECAVRSAATNLFEISAGGAVAAHIDTDRTVIQRSTVQLEERQQ
jgi:hypothetical protein